MSVPERIESLRQRITTVGELDPGLQLYGARIHRYLFAPPADPADVADAEKRWGVSLPEDYRAWITTVGNGGAGSGVGLDAFRGQRKSLGGPFPGADGRHDVDDELDDEAYDAEIDRWQQGTITLADTGSGYANRFVLVVDGNAPRRVWLEHTFNEDWWQPVADSFLSWMEDWIARLEADGQAAHTDREQRMDAARSSRNYRELADIYRIELCKVRAADTWYIRALEEDPNDVAAALGQAITYNAIGFHESAMNVAKRHRERCEPNPRAGDAQWWPLLSHELGIALHARGAFEDAARELDAAQSSLRRDQTLYLPPRVESHLEAGNINEAKRLLEVALRGAGTSLYQVGYQSTVFLNRRIEDKAERTLLTLERTGFESEADWLRKLRKRVESAEEK